MAHQKPIKNELERIIEEEGYRPCLFNHECFGFACSKYRDCELRGVTVRGNKKE